MIPVDLSANCEGRIYDPNGFRIQILGIRSRDPFSGSTDMSDADCQTIRHMVMVISNNKIHKHGQRVVRRHFKSRELNIPLTSVHHRS